MRLNATTVPEVFGREPVSGYAGGLINRELFDRVCCKIPPPSWRSQACLLSKKEPPGYIRHSRLGKKLFRNLVQREPPGFPDRGQPRVLKQLRSGPCLEVAQAAKNSLVVMGRATARSLLSLLMQGRASSPGSFPTRQGCWHASAC
jgi:hypothetical protein